MLDLPFVVDLLIQATMTVMPQLRLAREVDLDEELCGPIKLCERSLVTTPLKMVTQAIYLIATTSQHQGRRRPGDRMALRQRYPLVFVVLARDVMHKLVQLHLSLLHDLVAEILWLSFDARNQILLPRFGKLM
jgi:hypothetical protein